MTYFFNAIFSNHLSTELKISADFTLLNRAEFHSDVRTYAAELTFFENVGKHIHQTYRQHIQITQKQKSSFIGFGKDSFPLVCDGLSESTGDAKQ